MDHINIEALAKEKVELWKQVTRTIRQITRAKTQEEKLEKKLFLNSKIEEYEENVIPEELKFIELTKSKVTKTNQENNLMKVLEANPETKYVLFPKEINTFFENIKSFLNEYKQIISDIKKEQNFEKLENIRTQGYKKIKESKDELKTYQSTLLNDSVKLATDINNKYSKYLNTFNAYFKTLSLGIAITVITSLLAILGALHNMYIYVGAGLVGLGLTSLIGFYFYTDKKNKEIIKINKELIGTLESTEEKLEEKYKNAMMLRRKLRIDANQAKIFETLYEIKQIRQKTITKISQLLNMSSKIIREELQDLLEKKLIKKDLLIIKKEEFENYYKNTTLQTQGNVKIALDMLKDSEQLKLEDLKNEITNIEPIIESLRKKNIIDIKEIYQEDTEFVKNLLINQ